MQLSPGELLDKFSILTIKKEKGLEVEKEFQAFQIEANEYFENKPLSKSIFITLLSSNRIQFDLEDRIRVEKDLSEVGKIALEIRQYNDSRIILKNAINEILDYNYMELKKYNKGV